MNLPFWVMSLLINIFGSIRIQNNFFNNFFCFITQCLGFCFIKFPCCNSAFCLLIWSHFVKISLNIFIFIRFLLFFHLFYLLFMFFFHFFNLFLIITFNFFSFRFNFLESLAKYTFRLKYWLKKLISKWSNLFVHIFENINSIILILYIFFICYILFLLSFFYSSTRHFSIIYLFLKNSFF